MRRARLDAQLVVDSVHSPLAGTEVPFRALYRLVSNPDRTIMVHTILMTHDNLQLQKTVLVVGCSDSPVTSAVSTVLSSWKLEYARDNEEALALVEKSAFDLVITDQGSSGWKDAEMLRKVRLVRPHTRLIIVTDRSTPADVIAAIRVGAFSYFTKPLSTQALDEVLQLAMDSPAWEKAIEMLSGTDA
jgi:DNA-binding NtrC family response regulator